VKTLAFDFWNFRQYLRAVSEEMKGNLHLKELQKALQDEKYISADAIKKISELLHLKTDEKKYFLLLCKFNQSTDLEEKDEYYQKLIVIRKMHSVGKLDKKTYEFFSHWYVSVVLEALVKPLNEKQIPALAKSIGVSSMAVKQSLELCAKLGLAERFKDLWIRKSVQLESEREVQELYLRQYHRQMLARAVHSLEFDPADRREFTGLTICLSPKKMSELKTRIDEFIRETNALYSEDPNPKEIFQINLQLFSLGSLPD